MKRLLGLFFLLSVFLVLSCEKEDYLVSSSDPPIGIEHYFEYDYASSTLGQANSSYANQLETRNADSNWVQSTIIPAIDSLNNLNNFVPDWINNIGYAYWDKAAFSNSSKTAFIPFGFLNQNQVSAFLVVNEYQGDLRFRFVLRGPLVQNAQLELWERRSWYLYGKIMASLEMDVFGANTMPAGAITPLSLSDIIDLPDDSLGNNNLEVRCGILVTAHMVGDCWQTQFVQCDGSIVNGDLDCPEETGGGSSEGGSSSTGGFWVTEFLPGGSPDPINYWWEETDENSGNGGTSNSNDENNDNNNDNSPPTFTDGDLDLPEWLPPSGLCITEDDFTYIGDALYVSYSNFGQKFYHIHTGITVKVNINEVCMYTPHIYSANSTAIKVTSATYAATAGTEGWLNTKYTSTIPSADEVRAEWIRRMRQQLKSTVNASSSFITTPGTCQGVSPIPAKWGCY